MPKSSLSVLAVLVVGLTAATASAQTAPEPGWAVFTDPVEHAFTIEVPQGWRVLGGITRFAPSEAPSWITAYSPDGSIELFLNDPNIGTFTVPTPYFAEGSQAPGFHNRPSPVQRYRPGAEFAAMYGTRSLATACTNVQVQAMQPQPQIEGMLRQSSPGATRIDAGEADFTCTRNGRPFSATVLAGTTLTSLPGGGGLWQVPVLGGALAPSGQEEQAARLLAHMQSSYRPDPQFLAALHQAGDQEAATTRIQMQPAPPSPGPIVTPYRPLTPSAPRCDDLQQQRICNMNDGHLVTSGGCLKCVSP